MSRASARSSKRSAIADSAETKGARRTRSMRTPLSKQRNKHIQRVLVEAAKLAPRQSHELAVIYEREKQKGNAQSGDTGRSPEDGGVSACRGSREQRDFVPAEDRRTAAA